MLAEPRVSILALLVVVAILTIPELLAIYFWSKMHREINEALRQLAEDRASRSRAIVYIGGKEEAEKHDPDGESVEYLHTLGAPVEGSGEWDYWPTLPEVRQTPSKKGKT